MSKESFLKSRFLIFRTFIQSNFNCCPLEKRRAENLALHYRLLAQEEASPQSSVVSQPELENSSCLDRTSDVSKSYQLKETATVASPQFSVVSQSESENSACLDRTSDVSQSSRYLTIERDVSQPKFNRI